VRRQEEKEKLGKTLPPCSTSRPRKYNNLGTEFQFQNLIKRHIGFWASDSSNREKLRPRTGGILSKNLSDHGQGGKNGTVQHEKASRQDRRKRGKESTLNKPGQGKLGMEEAQSVKKSRKISKEHRYVLIKHRDFHRGTTSWIGDEEIRRLRVVEHCTGLAHLKAKAEMRRHAVRLEMKITPSMGRKDRKRDGIY